MSHQAIADALSHIFRGIGDLHRAFPAKKFTIDGRLVGDVGEVIAALQFDLTLHEKCEPRHDGRTRDGRNVQVKATFKDSLTFRFTPDYYIGLKLHQDGRFDVIFNGPGKVIAERYRDRKGIGDKLLSFPIGELQRLSERVSDEDRIPLRDATDAVAARGQ